MRRLGDLLPEADVIACIDNCTGNIDKNTAVIGQGVLTHGRYIATLCADTGY